MRRALMILTSTLAALAASGGAASARMPPPPPQANVDVRLVCEGRGCEEVYGRGGRYVVAEFGQRYVISLTNRSDQWVEAVVNVDGRNVVDGNRASSRGRGYLIRPYDSVQIEGWRVSTSEVAAFRFTSVGDSYAARVGDASQVGTIRVDVFPERRDTTWVPRPRPVDPRYYWGDDEGDVRRPHPSRAEEKSAGSADSAAPRSASRWRDDDGGQNLGTQFGESRWQPVTERDFQRANPTRPSQSLTLWYDNAQGLMSRGILPRPRRWIEEDDGGQHFVPPPPPLHHW